MGAILSYPATKFCPLHPNIRIARNSNRIDIKAIYFDGNWKFVFIRWITFWMINGFQLVIVSSSYRSVQTNFSVA